MTYIQDINTLSRDMVNILHYSTDILPKPTQRPHSQPLKTPEYMTVPVGIYH
jgi:hypothetical protein